MRPATLALLTAFFCTSTARADDVDIAMGRLTHIATYGIQTVGAMNNTSKQIEYLEVECGFFRDGQLIRSGYGVAQRIPSGQTAYFDVRSDNAQDADSAKCRVSKTR